jgi:hypothetical protein
MRLLLESIVDLITGKTTAQDGLLAQMLFLLACLGFHQFI